MNVNLNGSTIETKQSTLRAILEEQGYANKQGIAVAVNQSVVPQKKWEETNINQNDSILIITATQGG